MLTEEQNELLTRVGPGTPMGELMRRYWVPALLSWEVAGAGLPAGDDQAARRGAGRVPRRRTARVGVVGARCAHRRAHLFWGRNEENGIRCVYHGWKFDCEGNCVDMPSEPEESNFKDKVRIPAYPTYEAGGVVWAYMGPPEKKPAPPLFEWTQVPPDAPRRCPRSGSSATGCRPSRAASTPSTSTSSTAAGLRACGTTRTTPRGRANNFSHGAHPRGRPDRLRLHLRRHPRHGRRGHQPRPRLPLGHALAPDPRRRRVADIAGHMWVPMDDENTMVYNWSSSSTTSAQADQAATGRRPKPACDPVPERPTCRSGSATHASHVGAGNDFGADVDSTTTSAPCATRTTST